MIRELQWKDLDELVENYFSFYDEVENDNPDLGIIFYHSKPDFVSEIAWFTNLYTEVRRNDAVALVAEENGCTVGLCDVHRLRPGTEVSHIGVVGITVRKDYRGKGIGKALLEGVIENCRRNYDILTLGVFSINQNAISLYRKVGFVENGKLPYAVKRGDRYYDEIHMYYKL